MSTKNNLPAFFTLHYELNATGGKKIVADGAGTAPYNEKVVNKGLAALALETYGDESNHKRSGRSKA